MSIRDLLNSMANPFEPREDWMGRATWWWGPGQPPNVFGSGRQYVPFGQAMQASGRARIAPDASIAMPLPRLCSPDQHPFSTSTVGAGILSPVKWRGQGIFADNYALPDYVAREPNEGWWLSEGRDSNTGERVWMTNLSGLSGIAETFNPGTFGGAIRLGIAALVVWYGYKWLTSSSKKGRTANRRRRNRRRRNPYYSVQATRPFYTPPSKREKRQGQTGWSGSKQLPTFYVYDQHEKGARARAMDILGDVPEAHVGVGEIGDYVSNRGRRRRNSGNQKWLTPKGWKASWSGSRPNVIYLDDETGRNRSQSVIRYGRGHYGWDWPEVVPESVKKKLRALFERLHRA